MKWITLILAIAGPTMAFGEEARLSNAEIDSAIYLASRVTTNTRNAGHECLVGLTNLQKKPAACYKFRGMAGYAYDLHFKLDDILKADPYLNPLNIDMEGVYVVRGNYGAIKETERILNDIGFGWPSE